MLEVLSSIMLYWWKDSSAGGAKQVYGCSCGKDMQAVTVIAACELCTVYSQLWAYFCLPLCLPLVAATVQTTFSWRGEEITCFRNQLFSGWYALPCETLCSRASGWLETTLPPCCPGWVWEGEATWVTSPRALGPARAGAPQAFWHCLNQHPFPSRMRVEILFVSLTLWGIDF